MARLLLATVHRHRYASVATVRSGDWLQESVLIAIVYSAPWSTSVSSVIRSIYAVHAGQARLEVVSVSITTPSAHECMHDAHRGMEGGKEGGREGWS